MKQKVVIKISMNGHKSRSKAMKIAVGISGVESAALQGEDKSQIEVKGEGIDAVELTSLLRKNVGHAELITVSSVDEKKPDDQSKAQPMVWPPPPYVVPATYEIYAEPSSSIGGIYRRIYSLVVSYVIELATLCFNRLDLNFFKLSCPAGSRLYIQ